MTHRLLLIEDERSIAEPLSRYLETEGYSVEVASSLGEARRHAEKPDLVILDWMLPDGDGLEWLRSRSSAESAKTPVIMLTARTDLIDKVLGLELGADDYVTKPFEPRELLARVKARLRARSASPQGAEPKTLAHAGIELDDTTRIVTYRGTTVPLTRVEHDLLRLLLENVGRVFSRDELLNKVWGFDSYPTTRTVDTHILQLRQKFSPELFETVRGVGYRMTRKNSPYTNEELANT